MSVNLGDGEGSAQDAGMPNTSDSAHAEDLFHPGVCREDDPKLPALDLTPIAPGGEPQTSMGPADPDTPRNLEGDDGPFSEQTRELMLHPIPEWEDNNDPNLEAGD